MHALKRHIFTHMYRRPKIQNNKHVSKHQVVTEARRKQGYVCVGACMRACVCVCVSVHAVERSTRGGWGGSYAISSRVVREVLSEKGDI